MDSMKKNREMRPSIRRREDRSTYISPREHRGIVDKEVSEDTILMVRASAMREARKERTKQIIVLAISTMLTVALLISAIIFLA